MIETVEPPILLRPDDAARLIQVSRSHLYALIADGTLPSVRLGRSRRVPRAALEAWVARETDQPSSL